MTSGGNPRLRRAAARSPWSGLVTLALFVVAAVTVLPTTIVLLVGVVPMVVTTVIDDLPGRYLARIVAGMATAALIPMVGALWGAGHTMHAAMALVGNVYTWFAIYAAVGAGWLMFRGFPTLVTRIRQVNGQHRIARLRKQQQELVAEWGESIAEAPEPDPAPALADAGPAKAATPSGPAPSVPG